MGWLVPRLVASALLVLAVGCTAPSEDYTATIAAERAAKDEMFKSSDDSPVKPEERATRVPLTYYPVDEQYAVPAQLTPTEREVTLQIPTSTGKLRQMQQVGQLGFSVGGQALKLSVFLEEDGRLFIPFTDTTSGEETYPAGRYLNLDPTATGIYTVDFNTAYHPYCYYNDTYDCPFPPPENRLPVPIRAGERLPAAAASTP